MYSLQFDYERKQILQYYRVCNITDLCGMLIHFTYQNTLHCIASSPSYVPSQQYSLEKISMPKRHNLSIYVINQNMNSPHISLSSILHS